MLAVVGPVRLADGVTISAANVVQYTQQTLYARFPQTSQITERKNFLLELARAVSTKLLTPGIDSGGVLHAAGVGASQGRLLFWSRDANVERELQSVPLGGVVPDTKQPYVGLALNNDSQSKLDYYLHTSMQYASTGCGGTRDVTVTVTFTNDAPQNLPRYVIGNSFPKRTETLDVYLYGSVGARFTKVTSGGVTPFHLTAPDRGHPVYYASINVPPGRPTTVVYHLTEPASNGPLIVRDQPMVNPMTTTVSAAHCR
jgi:hypothetical protein